MAKGNSQKKSYAKDSGLNFKAQLWAAADKMRGHIDASEYKHVCNESAAKTKDVLRRAYEYFLGRFASAEGKGGGDFYNP